MIRPTFPTEIALPSVNQSAPSGPNVIWFGPEFATGAGNLVQLIIDEIEGERTAYCSFTEKQRAGRVVPDTSWFRQKNTTGTWGCIIRRPVAIVQMLGI